MEKPKDQPKDQPKEQPKIVYRTPEYNWVKDLISSSVEIAKSLISAKFAHDKTGLYIHLSIVVVLAASIGVLAWLDKIDGSVIGTLMGSLVGFAFGNFPARKEKGNSN